MVVVVLAEETGPMRRFQKSSTLMGRDWGLRSRRLLLRERWIG